MVVKGDALWPLLFNLPLDYAIRKVQVNQDGLKLNGTDQLLLYVDHVNILDGSMYTAKKGAFVVASKEISLEVNPEN